jgi:hypothetical protein
MGLTMSERRAVTRKLALEYGRSTRAGKGRILDQVCELTGWHWNHARKALKLALVIGEVRARPPRPPLYGEPVMEALRFCWAVQGTPCGRLLAPALRTWCRGCAGSVNSRWTMTRLRCWSG